MNIRTRIAASLLSVLVFPFYTAPWAAAAASTESTTNATTILASAPISPGRYSCTVSQNFNAAMADQLVKSIKKVPGLSKVEARVDDSSIHFTVDPHAHVQLSDIEKRVVQVDSLAVITKPILENSMTASPGL